MVEQHQVDITDVELAERFFDGVFGIGESVRVELRGDEQLPARNARPAEGFADLFFVAVESGCVELA